MRIVDKFLFLNGMGVSHAVLGAETGGNLLKKVI
jgi:hypothetical protein